ncbi:MAG: metallophosphoesterase family protein [Caldilineaceae bacterium]
MKIGLIADIHGNIHALDRVVQELQQRRVELLLCAGDLVCYGAFPNEVIARLKALAIPTVLGNYDSAVAWNMASASSTPSSLLTEPIKVAALEWTKEQITDEHRQYLRSLPWTTWHRFGSTSLQMLHGGPLKLDEWYGQEFPHRLTELAEKTAVDILVIGHTHQQFAVEIVRTNGEKTLIINPGAVGRSIDGDPRAACAVLDLATRQIELLRVDYNLDAAIQAIASSGMPKEIAELVARGLRRVEQLAATPP